MGIIKTSKLIFDYIRRDEEENIEEIKRAIDGVSLDIKAGQFVAILGHHGSGKSTFAKQLDAILLPTEGTVWIQGMDTSVEDNLWEVRKRTGMVFQNPDNQIIATVVEEDLGFGAENLGIPTDEIWLRVEESLKAVGMLEYRNHSPNKLSGGQKQRLCIARALLKNPKILILDDSTSAVDTKTDELIRQALKNDIPDTTKIIIAQRVASVKDADKIIVLNDGKINAIGTHDELLETSEIYREVYDSQNKGGVLHE